MPPETVIFISAVPVLKHCSSAELRSWTGQKNCIELDFFLEVAYPWYCFQPHQFNQWAFFPSNFSCYPTLLFSWNACSSFLQKPLLPTTNTAYVPQSVGVSGTEDQGKRKEESSVCVSRRFIPQRAQGLKTKYNGCAQTSKRGWYKGRVKYSDQSMINQGGA